MTFRRLPEEEWEKLRPMFKLYLNENPPSSGQATVVVAEENGQIVGCLVGQWVFHIEPLIIKETHRGRFLIPPLVTELIKQLPGMQYAFAHTESDKVGKLLKLFGMKELPWKTFRWIRRQSD